MMVEFTTEDDEDVSVVNSFEHDDFSKYRLTIGDATVNVMLMGVDQSFDDFVEQRKRSLESMDIAVPKPYKAEIESSEEDDEYALTFTEQSGAEYGLGYADPEYNRIMEDSYQVVRYRYLVTSREMDGRNAEIEVFIPVDDFETEEALSIAQSVQVV